jgi:hypothetical protein
VGADAHPLEQVVAHPESVGHRGEGGVDRPDAGEDACIGHIQVVELVRLAVHVEHRRLRVAAKAAGPGLMGDSGDRDLVLEIGVVGEKVPMMITS